MIRLGGDYRRFPIAPRTNLITGDHQQLTAYTHDEINTEAGSGGHEIRTWIALAGAVRKWKAELVTYEAVVPWATGCGLVEFNP